MSDDAMTCREVADELGLSPTTIRVYAHRYLIGLKHGRDWAFRASDVEQIRSRKGKLGRPPKVAVNA